MQGAEFEECFGGGYAPAGAGDVAVFDQVAAGTFDDAAGDGPAGREGLGVVQVGGLGVEVAGGPGCGFAAGGGELAASGGDGVADGGGHGGGVAIQDGRGAGADPRAGLGAGFGEEGPGGGLQVSGDVDEVADDRDADVPGCGFGADPVELVDVAVGRREPGPPAVRVAAVGLGEY